MLCLPTSKRRGSMKSNLNLGQNAAGSQEAISKKICSFGGPIVKSSDKLSYFLPVQSIHFLIIYTKGTINLKKLCHNLETDLRK